MKKVFNLSVILAALFAAFTFASCDDDEDDATEAVNEQNLTSINVVAGGKYSFKNDAVGQSGTINVTSVSGSTGSKVVTFTLELKGNDQNGVSFTIGDDASHQSYFSYVDGAFTTQGQSNINADASKVLFALSSDATAYTITSGTVNEKAKVNGATITYFADVTE